MSILSENIRKYRKEKNLTQKQLADLIGKSKNVISNWENGLNQPDANTIEYLLRIFEVDANTLLGWDNSSQIKREHLYTCTKDEEEMLIAYRNATDKGKYMAMGVLTSNQEENLNGSKKGA